MKLKKYNLFVVGMMVLMMFCFSASAETVDDDNDDIFHATWDETLLKYTTSPSSVDKPSIDITGMSAEVDGTNLTITLTVAEDGEIVNSSLVGYTVFYNTSDAAYVVIYSSGISIVTSISIDNPLDFGMGEASAEGNILTATIELKGEETSPTEFYAMSMETSVPSTDPSYATAERWLDWAPNSFMNIELAGGDGDGDGDGDDGTSTGTPGFETLAVIAALGIALFIFRRRK